MSKTTELTLDASLDPVVAPEPQAQFSLDATSYSGDEGTNIQFGINRTVRTDQTLTIDWAITNATAVPLSGTETFNPGDTQKNISVAAQLINTTENGDVTLANPQYVSGPVAVPVLGSPSTATFQIIDLSSPTNRPANAGIYLIWGNNTEVARCMDFPEITGNFVRTDLSDYVTDGDPFTSPYGKSQLNTLQGYTDDAVGGPKYSHMAISGKKDQFWEPHFWNVHDPRSFEPAYWRFEEWIKDQGGATPNADRWIPCWNDGGHGELWVRGIYDLALDHYDTLTASQQSRTVGIRVSQNAITVEESLPDGTLRDSAIYQQGSSNSEPRPPDMTSGNTSSVISEYHTHMLDRAFPVSDNDEPLYPLLFRPNLIDDDATLQARVEALMVANKIGYVGTGQLAEPKNNAQLLKAQEMMTFCKLPGGNTKCFSEKHGDEAGATGQDLNCSNLQLLYWKILIDLHVGVAFPAMRTEYVLGKEDGFDAENRAEWQAILDFGDKYAASEQFPATATGCWLALREGSRLQGNYNQLMTQVITGAGDRGAEYWCGADGNDWNGHGGTVGYTGRPFSKADQTSREGLGQRQSLWAFLFLSGQHLKLKLDATWASAHNGQNLEVDIHYLDENSAASINVDIFGATQTSINVGATDDWIIKTYSIPAASISTDVDGAHIDISPSGAFVKFHMVECRVA